MPGLLGYYDPQRVLPSATELRMARALRTDSRCREAFAHENGACIGAVDRGVFSGAGQVVHSADGCRKVCFQGEILAFSGEEEAVDPVDAIRRCFCQRLDVDLLSRAVGSFVAAILDTSANTLEIVTDHNGTYPVYYARVDELFLFAGQQKALLATGRIKPEVDPLAVSLMLQSGYVGGEMTLLKDIRVAPPGSIIRMGPSGMSIDQYWAHEFGCDQARNWDREVDRLGVLLARAVRRVFRSGARIGVPVSGGLDSRTLLALSPDPSRVPSFTFGATRCRDLRFGAGVARAVGSPHHALAVDGRYLNELIHVGVWLTEGLLGATHFHVLPHVPEFARWADVVLDGIGGDVILGGKYVKRPWLGTRDFGLAGDAIWSWLANQVPTHLTGLLATRLAPADAHAQAKALFKTRFKESPGLTPMDRAMAFLLNDRTRRFIGCGSELLRWRVESHRPFFDNDFVVAVARLPHSWRKHHRLFVAVLKRAAPAAAGVRWQHTNLPVAVPYCVSWLSMAFHRAADKAASRLGISTLFRHREMSRFSIWLRGPLRRLLDEILLSPRALDRGLVSPGLVRRVVDGHLQGDGDYCSLLGVLLSLELFCRDFVDDCQSAIEKWSCSPKLRGRGAPQGASAAV